MAVFELSWLNPYTWEILADLYHRSLSLFLFAVLWTIFPFLMVTNTTHYIPWLVPLAVFAVSWLDSDKWETLADLYDRSLSLSQALCYGQIGLVFRKIIRQYSIPWLVPLAVFAVSWLDPDTRETLADLSSCAQALLLHASTFKFFVVNSYNFISGGDPVLPQKPGSALGISNVERFFSWMNI